MNGAIIENCHVDGGTITSVPENTGSAYDNGDKAGGIIGYYVTGDKVTNCSAKNLTITAYRDFGGIVGCGPESGMTDCSVENITLVQDNTNGYESEAVTTVGGDLVVPADATLNLNGKTLTAKCIQAANDNSVIAITNGTVEFSGTGNGVELNAGNSTLTLDGVKLDAPSLSGPAICSGSNDHPEWADNKIVIRNSIIQAKHAGILLDII